MFGHRARPLAPFALAVALALCSAAVARPPHAAYALGPGQVCVFLAPQGAPIAGLYTGHVGWAFLEGGTSNWIFGATENVSGRPFVKPGDNNYAWVSNGP